MNIFILAQLPRTPRWVREYILLKTFLLPLQLVLSTNKHNEKRRN